MSDGGTVVAWIAGQGSMKAAVDAMLATPMAHAALHDRYRMRIVSAEHRVYYHCNPCCQT